MKMTSDIVPFSLKDSPALIEVLLPVQKLSVEAYKEQMANIGKTLTSLGGYWKGRKPLILAKACVLGCLLPATDDHVKDLEIFEKLMAMDDESFAIRYKRHPKAKEILSTIPIACITDYFDVQPNGILPTSSPVDWSNPEYDAVKVTWRDDINKLKRRQLEAQMLPKISYRERVEKAWRPEEVMGTVHDHIWDMVNTHLGTQAYCFPDLVEQLGIMRFGHRPCIADTFCGSGQIPFEAATLGCDVYASDLNPIACMLTWGAFNIVGGSLERYNDFEYHQQELIRKIQVKIDELGIDTDGNGWQAKSYLYCLEARCPQTGWTVPLLPSLIIGKVSNTIAELIPDSIHKRYDIRVRSGVTDEEMKIAEHGTVIRDGRSSEANIIHQVDGVNYKTKISTLRGDYQKPDGTISNRIRLWDKNEFKSRPEDIFQERLYAIHWMRKKKNGKGYDFEFRSVTKEDLDRERIVETFVSTHFAEWQENGYVPDMRIEVGGPPRYQGLDLIRARGWTYWHHLFNARQLLYFAFMKCALKDNPHAGSLSIFFTKALNWNARLCIWNYHWEVPVGVFYNQALNTLYNYGTRSYSFLTPTFLTKPSSFPFHNIQTATICGPADGIYQKNDIYITDPPYGDAVKYEEILDFFIAWLRKNPPSEFSDWTWDSRRLLAIKGEEEDFRRGMVAAYKHMAEHMPDNGIQVIMFTHQDGSIWADMANIVWASGLQVTAAWYIVTETDSALREGSHIKGTILLVCRKRRGIIKTTRDDLAWEIQEEVQAQVEALTGLNYNVKNIYHDENVFDDADIQMAGYAAALRALTRYAIIDSREMTTEAIRPRVKGETTFVDSLIEFAVNTANQYLVPMGIEKRHWDKLSGAERFYLKMLELESRGVKKLDNYQNFAKAFKVHDFWALMETQKANNTHLKTAAKFGRTEMSEDSELYQSVLRAILYAIMELEKNTDGSQVLTHLTINIPNYYSDSTQRELAISLSEYLVKYLEVLYPEDASAARILRELIKNQRIG